MTLGYLGMLLPLAEIAAVVRLVLRIHYRRCPALLAFLVLEAIAQITTLAAWPDWVSTWVWLQPLRMLVRFLVVVEVLRFGCVTLSRVQCWGAALWVLVVCALCCAAFGFTRLSPFQSAMLFREFFHLILAAVLVGLSLYLWRNPIMENRDHKAHRIGMTAAMVSLAAAGCFVRQGFGYMIFPYSRKTWIIVDRAQWVSMILIIVGLAWGMTSNISCCRPAVAERIKARAARRLGTCA